MAKRFTDTEKWKKPFIRNLPLKYKAFWLYILDECDHAGIWQVDFEVARIRIGDESINPNEALTFMSEKIVIIDNGHKWHIPSFIDFQYPNGLNDKNKVHASVIKILSRINQAPSKTLASPLDGATLAPTHGAKDKDKDKDIVFNKKMVSLEKSEIERARFTVKGAKGFMPLDDAIISYFEAFKGQDKIYDDRGKMIDHFVNWVKFQEFTSAALLPGHKMIY